MTSEHKCKYCGLSHKGEGSCLANVYNNERDMTTPREILTDLSGVYTNHEKHINIALKQLAEWVRRKKEEVAVSVPSYLQDIHEARKIRNKILEKLAREIEK